MKKKWLALLIILCLLLCLAGGAWAYLYFNGLWFSTGTCMVTDDGSVLILLDGSPIVLRNCTDREGLLDDLHTGDTVRILHDGIQESYPGGTGVYFCRVVERGDIGDIPESILESLSPMGWRVIDSTGKTREIYTGTVENYQEVYADAGNFLLKLYVDDFMEQAMTFTVVSTTVVESPDGIQPGDRVRLTCVTESSGYKEVLSLVEQ